MANDYFGFKQFTVFHNRCAFKVGTDGVLLGAVADVQGAASILDIGTGSGLIALMLAQRSQAGITAIESDEESYVQACENFCQSPWKERINAVNTDIRMFRSDSPFDLIVSNPPYFSNSLPNPDLRKSAARHNISLSGTELLSAVSRLLAPGGKFEVIMPFAEGNILIAEGGDFGLFCNNILKIRPTGASEVRRLILSFSRRQTVATEKFLTIEHGKRHEFTEEYRDLTKEFYLKF